MSVLSNFFRKRFISLFNKKNDQAWAGTFYTFLQLVYSAAVSLNILGPPIIFSPIGIVAIYCLFIPFLISFSKLNVAERRPTLIVLIFSFSSLISIILLFANLYRWAAIAISCVLTVNNRVATCNTEITHNFWDCVYFSVITITTVGYGDFYPSGPHARVIASIEALSGYIILGLFISSLSNMVRLQKPPLGP
jgi:hypothetical protein